MALVCDQQDPKRGDCPYCQNNLYGQCTDGMWHWTSDNGASPKLPGAMGDAHSWVDYAHSAGWTVDNAPKVGTLICYAGGLPGSEGHGHIAAVTEVNGQQIKVIEMNWRYKAPSGIADCRSDGPGSPDGDFSAYWAGFITVPGVTPGASGQPTAGASGLGGLDLTGISKALQQVEAELAAAAKNAENEAISGLQVAAGGLVMAGGGYLLLSGSKTAQQGAHRVRTFAEGAATGRLLRRRGSQVPGQPARPTHLTSAERGWVSRGTREGLRETQPPVRPAARPAGRTGGLSTQQAARRGNTGRTGQVPVSPSMPPGRVPRYEQEFSGTPGARAAQTRAERQSAREQVAYMAGHARGQQAARGQRATVAKRKRPKGGRERIPF